MVRYELDPLNPPPLTKEQEAELAALARMSDDEIDFSDIPEADDRFFERARPAHFRPLKQQLTLRIDTDLIAWFKQEAGGDGRGYQTRINQALREYVVSKQQARKKAG
ncbi:hypothetical protein JP74_12130 [Devosia sp. 17-2-E-8]|nr:hypothetical protein JP74_12130 [Devosia sp. 17-2-E-8]